MTEALELMTTEEINDVMAKNCINNGEDTCLYTATRESKYCEDCLFFFTEQDLM